VGKWSYDTEPGSRGMYVANALAVAVKSMMTGCSINHLQTVASNCDESACMHECFIASVNVAVTYMRGPTSE
jgi:hypothetical protein